MYGVKYNRLDVQLELVNQMREGAVPHTIDAARFVRVESQDALGRLERYESEIWDRELVEWTSFLTETEAAAEETALELHARGEPYVRSEYETDESHAAPHRGRGWGLAIRRESSLPKGQRPWDKK